MTPWWRTRESRLLPEGRLSGPMPWVIGIMMFLMALAAGGGLALNTAASSLGRDVADRVTIQIVEADPPTREAQARALMSALPGQAGVLAVDRIDEAEMRALLEPWLGAAAGAGEVPLPALIDVELSAAGHARLDRFAADVRSIAPAARIDDHAATLAPLVKLIGSLEWLALAIVLLMAAATASAVVLAARAALDTHRATIDVMHLLGATDVQIARLFQRRIAIDALLGGLAGLAAAAVVMLILGRRIVGIGSELLGAVTLSTASWATIAALPLAGALLATVATRWTVLATLRRIL